MLPDLLGISAAYVNCEKDKYCKNNSLLLPNKTFKSCIHSDFDLGNMNLNEDNKPKSLIGHLI